MIRVGLMLGTLLAVVGCGPRLPVYPLTDDATSLATITRRDANIRSFSAPCVLILSEPGSFPVRLDGVLAARAPGFLRVRAFRAGATVMDLTVRPEGVWLWSERPEAVQAEPAGPAPVPGRWLPLWPTWPQGQTRGDDRTLTVSAPVVGGEGLAAEWTIDRPTLTVRALTVRHGDATVYRAELSGYARLGEAVWPRRIAFVAEGRRFEVRLGAIELNPELPDAAFRPSPRARRVR